MTRAYAQHVAAAFSLSDRAGLFAGGPVWCAATIAVDLKCTMFVNVDRDAKRIDCKVFRAERCESAAEGLDCLRRSALAYVTGNDRHFLGGVSGRIVASYIARLVEQEADIYDSVRRLHVLAVRFCQPGAKGAANALFGPA
jgi:hypothetical protein